MIGINIDVLLQRLALGSTILFVIFLIVFIIQSLRKHGLISTLIRLISYRVILPLLLVIGINLLSLAIVFVEPQQVGVVVSALSPGGIRPQPLPAGLHVIVPLLEQAVRYPIYWQTYTMSGKPTEGTKVGDDSIRGRTNDGQEVRLDISAIYRINADQAVLVHIDWQDRYAEDFVRPIIRGVVRTQVSQFNVDEVNSEARRDLEASLESLLQEEFAAKGFILDQFLVRDITFREEYALSVELKQVALEQQIQALYEAERQRRLARGQGDAIQIVAEAEAEAIRLIGDALAENRDVLTYRYIDHIAPNIRVMLLPNNNPLILPLPDLMESTEPISPTLPITSTTDPDDSNVPVVPAPTPIGRLSQ